MKTGDWTDGKVGDDKNKRAPHPCSCRFFRYMSVVWEETTYYLTGMLRPAWGMVVWSSCHDHPHLFIISSTVKNFFPWELLITVPSGKPFLFWTFPLVDCVHDAAAKKITPSMDFRIFHVVPMKAQWWDFCDFLSFRFFAQVCSCTSRRAYANSSPWAHAPVGRNVLLPMGRSIYESGTWKIWKKNLGQQ